jgi:peptide/nickel transport system substrate-binding protein
VNIRKRHWIIFVALIVVLALGACAGGGQAPAAEQAAPSQEQAAAPAQESAAVEGGCPAVTVDDPKGVPAGAFPQQYELSEFQELAGCELTFSENPDIADLNSQIARNPSDLPSVAERLPEEPLVVAPYHEIGAYGGTLDGLSNATEAGTSDLLSVRHVNLVRFSDDLQTVVPNVAKGWEWNDDFTELTFFLRKGHKWSDGEPFTADDIVFWYNDLILNPDVYPDTPTAWLFDGQPMKVEAIDDTTVKMTFPTPFPGMLLRLAQVFAQPFQPKHFYERVMAEEGMSLGEAASLFYGNSDWKDVPSPLLSGEADYVVPTLESHILVEETTTGRRLVANPYFHMVDTQGHQLPYINQISELYVPDAEVRNLKITNGEVDYKGQAVFIENFPLYKENEANGNYTVELANGVGENIFYGFNLTVKDEGLREIFNDLRFRQAMSLAINRPEIVEIVYLGQAEPMQATPADPNTVSFVTKEHLTSFIEYDPDRANALLDEMGLKDVNGDGFRERLDGSNLTILLQFSNQGAPVKMHELVKEYWADVGVRVELKEVTSDEYREQGLNNDLDMSVWKNDNTSGVVIAQTPFMVVPEFGDRWNPGIADLWAEWHDTNGASGIEPPDDVKRLYDLVTQFVQVPLGSEESNRIGKEIVDIHVNNLWKIGIAGNIKTPVIHHNSLGNFGPYPAKTFDYYWAYPYRPNQWFIKQ